MKVSNKEYALCIIDLQSDFSSSISYKVITSVRKEINKAINRGNDILTVLYRQAGNLIPEIEELVKSYDKNQYVWKSTDSGANEVYNALFSPQNIKVCGVNTDACVLRTVTDLSKIYFRDRRYNDKHIRILEHACWSVTGEAGHMKGINLMRKNENVKLY